MKQIYHPSNEELEEMGFDEWWDISLWSVASTDRDWEYLAIVVHYSDYASWEINTDWGNVTSKIYPTSKEQVETLIRLFTK